MRQAASTAAGITSVPISGTEQIGDQPELRDTG
jgi:hypothetical protein